MVFQVWNIDIVEGLEAGICEISDSQFMELVHVDTNLHTFELNSQCCQILSKRTILTRFQSAIRTEMTEEAELN